MSSFLSLTPPFQAWNSRSGAIEGDVIGFKSHSELIDNTPPPPPLPSKDGASSTAFDSLHTRVSALESLLNPLHDSFLQCTSRLHALQSSMESHKEVSIRSMEQIREKKSKLEISHGGMRSEFEVVVGTLGVLTARVEEFHGEEFLRRFPINEIARPQFDLLAQTALDALHSCQAKVQFALENFIVSREVFQSMFEGSFSNVHSSFCGEVSDLIVNRICKSLFTFQPVPTILSRLTKVDEEVSAWAEWKGDETYPPDETVEVSHTPSSSSAYHGSLDEHEKKTAPHLAGAGGTRPSMSEPVALCELPAHKWPPHFLDSQFLRVHPVFEAMATGKMELFRREPIRDVPVGKIFLDRWSFASFVINASKASLGQDAVGEYVKSNPEAAPLINEVDFKQGPEPKDILWSSISRDWDLLDNDTKKDITDKLKRPTWKLKDPGHPPTSPSFKREWVLFAAYWKPRVPEVIMTHTLLSSLPEAKKEFYGALHKHLGRKYDHIWDDPVIRGSDQEDRGDFGDLWLSKQPPKVKTVDGHTQWVIVWCVHGQRASPVTP